MAGRAARASTTIPPIRPRCSPSASDTPHTQPSPPRIRMLGYDLPRFHAAGIPNAALQAEIESREAGHHHEAGEAEEHEHGAPPDTAKAAAPTRAPGKPPHKP